MGRSKVLFSDLRRMACSLKCYAAWFIGFFVLVRPLIDIWGTWQYYTPMELLSLPLGSSDFSPYAAIFCVLPFADSFCDDYISGYGRFITLRCGKKKYSVCRCFSVALSGGIVISTIMAMTIALCFLLAGQQETTDSMSFLSSSVWYKLGIVSPESVGIMCMLHIAVAFLFGALWALVGLSVSVIVPNQYVTLAAPFVLYQFLWFVLNESPLNPVYQFRGDSNFIPSFWFLILYQTMLITLCSLFSILGIRKRVAA